MASFLTFVPSCTAACRARAAPEEMPYSSADFVDECFHILDLTRDGIGLGIATLAAATLVIVVDRKAGRKEFGKLWSGPEGP